MYSYSGVQAQANGSVYALTGLLCNVTHDGYRLPTESEWEFAARGGTSANPFSVPVDSILAQEDAWYASNSGGMLHPVASKQPNALGFYDLAGNVFEWTNDWKQAYNGIPITNSLGGLQPDNAYEKVIKGGAYDYDMMYLRPSIRSATYSTTLSASCDYVGFRCARGPIPNGQYIGVPLQSLTPNPVTIVASTDTLLSFLGTVTAKIVFVNVTGSFRHLCLVDFSKTIAYVTEYSDDTNVYFPVISPDGNYAAYCSRDVGLSGPSSITIRSLDSLSSPKILLAADSAYMPRWWLNPATGDTCIVYTNSAIDDGSSLWSATRTLVQKVSAGKPVGTPQVLVASGSFHDGVSVNGNCIVTGYTELIMRNLLTSQNQQLFLSPNNGKNAEGSSQVCNVSMSPDTGGQVRCLFLDFGYSGVSTVTGTPYGIHQYIFEATPADTIVNFMHCPAGEASWDNPSWTNTLNFAVACVRNSSDQAHAIHLVNLGAGQSMALLSGIELEQPYCWVGRQPANSFNLALDSLGLYDTPDLASA